jgi:hypothetical protein
MFSNRVSMERDTPSPEPLVYPFLSTRDPKKEPSYRMGKNIRSLSMEPHSDRRPTYDGVWPGSPRGSFATLLSLTQWHASLDKIPSMGYTLHTCYCLPRDPGRVEYECTTPRGMDKGLDLWEARYSMLVRHCNGSSDLSDEISLVFSCIVVQSLISIFAVDVEK